MAIHKAHFERLFRRRNPSTIKLMTRQLAINITKRMSRPNLVQHVPLLRFLVLKIQELNGERRMKKKLKDEDFSLPYFDFSDSSSFSRAKSVKSNRTFPLMSHQSPRMRGHEPIIMPQLPQAANQTLQFVSQSYIPNLENPALNSGPSVIFSDVVNSTEEEQQPPNARDGIFVKLMQLSNPGIERKHMNVSQEEYNYLVQLRKRMAKQMKDFYPYKSSEQILGTAVGTTSASPRSRLVQKPSRGGATGLPALPLSPKSARKSVGKHVPAKGQNSTKNINFSLPKF